MGSQLIPSLIIQHDIVCGAVFDIELCRLNMTPYQMLRERGKPGPLREWWELYARMSWNVGTGRFCCGPSVHVGPAWRERVHRAGKTAFSLRRGWAVVVL